MLGGQSRTKGKHLEKYLQEEVGRKCLNMVSSCIVGTVVSQAITGEAAIGSKLDYNHQTMQPLLLLHQLRKNQ
jgi:hypothetical protein